MHSLLPILIHALGLGLVGGVLAADRLVGLRHGPRSHALRHALPPPCGGCSSLANSPKKLVEDLRRHSRRLRSTPAKLNLNLHRGSVRLHTLDLEGLQDLASSPLQVLGRGTVGRLDVGELGGIGLLQIQGNSTKRKPELHKQC